MTYTPPQNVVAPKRRWQQMAVLLDAGPGEYSYAMGIWDDDKVIVFRWNGTDASPGGNPQSRGHPTWIVLPKHLYPAIVDMLPPAKRDLARLYLELPEQGAAQ